MQSRAPLFLFIALAGLLSGTGGKLLSQSRGTESWFEKLHPEVREIKSYDIAQQENGTFLEMEFGSAVIRNPAAWQGYGHRIARVDLLLTRYPHDLSTWEIGYDALMESRYRNLMHLIPELGTTEGVRWRVFLQTAGTDLESAKKLKHGFVVYPADPQPAPEPLKKDSIRPPRFDSLKLRENYLAVTRIRQGAENYHDSTAIIAFSRNPEWTGLVLAADWTASMYRHGAQFIRWLLEHRDRGTVRNFVLFNDGDGKYDDQKTVGSTGGIYPTQDDSDEELNAAMESATLGGEGGDHRENDVEALVRAAELCPECRLVLIADNSGPVRDLSLLTQIDRPVSIVLCGVYKEDIHPDYLTIAHYTGGSIHTRDQDYRDLAGLVKRGLLVLGENEFELQGKRFVKKRKY